VAKAKFNTLGCICDPARLKTRKYRCLYEGGCTNTATVALDDDCGRLVSLCAKHFKEHAAACEALIKVGDRVGAVKAIETSTGCERRVALAMVIAREQGDDCPEYGTPAFTRWLYKRWEKGLLGLRPEAAPPTKTWAEMTPKERQDAAARLSTEQKVEISNKIVADFLARVKSAEAEK
jgi:hypothetical protein